MPDNIQARTDPMPPSKRKRPILTSMILLAIVAGIFAIIVFGS